ncbi:flagellin [Acidithrix sp. C25]|uniref:flagellin N-terminal helical domain-containing protein n=1 Tax=Acidithrix sp. C25 TaxID=1671482 RepID=UPI00191BC673|nr:flagellin [Acidithrix sp. C25]CAG4933779.1 unnamed protein product [Acidithrix sp. C25]
MTDRIGNASLVGSLVNSVQGDQNTLVNLQQLLATGNNISKPSDSPVGISNLLAVQTGLSRANQFVANAKDGSTMLGVANGAMSTAMNVLQQARTAILSAGNGALPSASIKAIANQINGYVQTLAGIANTQYLGVAIFGGTSGAQSAYTPTTTSGTTVYTYQGNGVAPSRTVAPGVTVNASLADAFGTGNPPSNPASPVSGELGYANNTANIMTTLSSIVKDLQSGSSANMSTDLGKFDTAFAVFQTNAGQVGAQYQQMQAMQQQTTYTQQSLNTQLGAIQNVDVASVSTQYQQALSNYQVALYATAQLGQQPSLATYLH